MGMVDATTALKASTVIGTVYAANCLFNTKQYLSDQGVPQSSGSAYLTRGIAGGVIGITVATGMAATSPSNEAKIIALAGNIAAFSSWCTFAVMKNMSDPTNGSKV